MTVFVFGRIQEIWLFLEKTYYYYYYYSYRMRIGYGDRCVCGGPVRYGCLLLLLLLIYVSVSLSCRTIYHFVPDLFLSLYVSL